MNLYLKLKKYCSAYIRRRRIPWKVLGTLAAFSLCAVLFLCTLSSVSLQTQEAQIENLQSAILQSAVHCYAVEGAYPESLDYLKEFYGISWDPEKYTVDYEIFGSNMKPAVTVIPRTGWRDR